MNYRLDIQYDGTRYEGWQRQKTTGNTIQGKIEEVLSRMLDAPVQIDGAGRTDAGVHSKGQVANVHMDTEKNCEEICAYLNRYLPEDIEIISHPGAGALPQPPSGKEKSLSVQNSNRPSQKCI